MIVCVVVDGTCGADGEIALSMFVQTCLERAREDGPQICASVWKFCIDEIATVQHDAVCAT